MDRQLRRTQAALRRAAENSGYGRTLARVRVGGVDVARAMIVAGHGRGAYHGGRRQGWC